MIVMPANATGWFWHSLARETGRLGHLYSPGAQRGPWPWFPYALDNGAFSCWDRETNRFDHAKWQATEYAWRRLLFWAQCAPTRPIWSIVPDVPGNADATMAQWLAFAPAVVRAGFPLAVAVQDGMMPQDVRRLQPAPVVICVGGTTEWKWQTVEMWCSEFPRVHVLRCNSPKRLWELERMGCESTDGTGWNRGDREQTSGLEAWARTGGKPVDSPLWPHVCRGERNPAQLRFA